MVGRSHDDSPAFFLLQEPFFNQVPGQPSCQPGQQERGQHQSDNMFRRQPYDQGLLQRVGIYIGAVRDIAGVAAEVQRREIVQPEGDNHHRKAENADGFRYRML